jgi:hypothetical protein
MVGHKLKMPSQSPDTDGAPAKSTSACRFLENLRLVTSSRRRFGHGTDISDHDAFKASRRDLPCYQIRSMPAKCENSSASSDFTSKEIQIKSVKPQPSKNQNQNHK